MNVFPMLLVRTDKPAPRRLFRNDVAGRMQALLESPAGSRLVPCRWPVAGEDETVAGYVAPGLVLDLSARF